MPQFPSLNLDTTPTTSTTNSPTPSEVHPGHD
ncbi:hypothetical protein A2U01_0081835, partial [Trifolium medium]|nr:hypothetical protein [Trifolium medium]